VADLEDDDVIVDLEPKETKKTDIEVEDDTPEADRGRPARRPGTPSAIPAEDEIGLYTKGVQDRLRKMSWEFHEERRAKEQYMRENEQAIAFAKRLLEQNKHYQSVIEKGHKTLVDATHKSAENEITTIRSALSQAIAAGDGEKIAELNEKLGRATARSEAALHTPVPRFEPQEEVRQPQTQQQPQVVLSEATQDWMDKNPWFQNDQRMTAIAMAAHEELIRSGVRVESKAYFEGIDKEMREVFPDAFEEKQTNRGSSPPTRRSPVAPTRRAPAQDSGKVKLTASEARVAEKLGVPLAEYARQKMLRMESEK
jgi:hypothetical protein